MSILSSSGGEHVARLLVDECCWKLFQVILNVVQNFQKFWVIGNISTVAICGGMITQGWSRCVYPCLIRSMVCVTVLCLSYPFCCPGICTNIGSKTVGPLRVLPLIPILYCCGSTVAADKIQPWWITCMHCVGCRLVTSGWSLYIAAGWMSLVFIWLVQQRWHA